MVRKKQNPQIESSDQKLKQANKELRAQVRNLRKQLKQQQELVSGYAHALSEDEPDSQSPPTSSQPSHKCKKCKSPTIDIPAGVFTIRKCEECGWRVKLKLGASE